MFALEFLAISGLCASILVTDLNRIRRRVTGDFEHFYFAAEAVARGTDPYAAGSRGYIYPPLIAFVFQPLASLGRDRAAAVMLAVNVFVTLVGANLASREFLRRNTCAECERKDAKARSREAAKAVEQLRHHDNHFFYFPYLLRAFLPSRLRVGIDPTSPIPRALAITTVMLAAMLLNVDKIKGEWQMWQTDVFMLLLFVLGLRWLDRRPFWAGIALGIAVNIKYLPLLFLPYLILRRRWRASAGLLVGTMIFAVLPAISTGWNANIRNWHTAISGLLQMADVPTKAAEAAEVHDVKDSLSCSITSAFARGFGPARGFTLAAATAAVAMGFSGWFYRRRGVSMFDHRLSENPAATGAEWVMLVTAVLVFGPQTNTRHLFDALIFTSASATLLLFAKPNLNRWPLLVGTAIVFLGFILPPGSRTVIGERTPTVLWLRMGGPCWCLLVGSMTLLWTTLECTCSPPAARVAPASIPSNVSPAISHTPANPHRASIRWWWPHDETPPR